MKKPHHSSLITHYFNNKGQSLIEILVSLAVGTILIIAAVSVIAPALRANTQADKVQVSSALGKELLENVRVFSEADWYNISSLATSSANKYFLVSTRSPFIAATGTEGISADGIASGTVGYWKLDESTSTIAYDFSGNGNNGTLYNSPASTTGQIGQARSFNGANYVQVNNSSSISMGTSAHTVTAWIKLNSYGTYRPVVAKRSGGTVDFSYHINDSAGDGKMASYNGLNSVGSTNAVSLGAWHHVAWVYSDGTISFYLDGASNGSASQTSGAANSANLYIGTDNGTTQYYFDGAIDDARLYNRALSATEIKNIYQAAIYTRYFYLDDVGRDVSDALLSSGGTNDPSTKKTTVVYGWPNGPTSSFSMYLTRFRNNVFDQTDWSGGPGQEGPATTTNSGFSTSTQIYYSTTTGSIIINFQ